MILYRATDRTETGIPPRSCWGEDQATARAYVVPGVGHGGATLRTIEIDDDSSQVLDITTGLQALAEALDYDDAYETARRWVESGWLYPWEESQQVCDRLMASGYDWLRYVDDYPEGAITMMRIAPDA